MAHDRELRGNFHRSGLTLAAGSGPALPEHRSLAAAVLQLLYLVCNLSMEIRPSLATCVAGFVAAVGAIFRPVSVFPCCTLTTSFHTIQQFHNTVHTT